MAYESNRRRKRPAANGKRIPVSTYVEPGDFDKLAALADRNERPVAAEIRLAIRGHLKKEAAA